MKSIIIELTYFIKRLFIVKGKDYYSIKNARNSKCYCVGDVDAIDNILLSRYYDCERVDDANLLSWKSIFFDKIAFRKIKVDSLKSFLCKNAKINYFDISRLVSVIDFVFTKSSKKCLVVDSLHVADMFRIVFPRYDVFLISNKLNFFFERILFLLSKLILWKDINSNLVVFFNVQKLHFLYAYKNIHPNKKIILRFHDFIDEIFCGESFDKARLFVKQLNKNNIVTRIETYNKDEAHILNINYVPNAISSDICKARPQSKYLFAFVGSCGSDNDSRKYYMDKLKDAVGDMFGTHEGYVYEYLVSGRHGNPMLSYLEYLTVISESEILVDFFRLDPNEGLSFRTSEAILMDKKIITNRTSIKTYDFYDPDKVFILGEDNFEMLGDFIRRTVPPYPDEIKRKYDNSLWWNDL